MYTRLNAITAAASAQRHLIGAVRRLTGSTIHISPAGAHHPPLAARQSG